MPRAEHGWSDLFLQEHIQAYHEKNQCLLQPSYQDIGGGPMSASNRWSNAECDEEELLE